MVDELAKKKRRNLLTKPYKRLILSLSPHDWRTCTFEEDIIMKKQQQYQNRCCCRNWRSTVLCTGDVLSQYRSPVPNTNISLQYAVLALLAAMYGPVTKRSDRLHRSCTDRPVMGRKPVVSCNHFHCWCGYRPVYKETGTFRKATQ